MIHSLVQRVRDWSLFIRLVLTITLVVGVFNLGLGDFNNAVLVTYAGATMIAAGEYLAPAVSSALFCRVHERTGVPAYCGDPVAPTAAQWHRAIVSMVGAYSFIVISTALLRQEFTTGMLMDACGFVATWSAVFLFIHLLSQAMHFLGHRRVHREELAAQEQQRREQQDARTEQAFWEITRGYKPDPGGVA